MKIQIKQALLEGYSPEVIVEAVHANHPGLDKRNPETKANRDSLAKDIKAVRGSGRSMHPQVDNYARSMSQVGRTSGYPVDHTKEFQAIKTKNAQTMIDKAFKETPRIISSAKQ
jgi:hypothetical protein